MQTISIRVIKGLVFKETNCITHIEGRSNHSRIYYTNESFPLTVANVLAWFVLKLPKQDFIRTHCIQLVNKQFIGKKDETTVVTKQRNYLYHQAEKK